MLHAVRRYGETSQTFIADLVAETDKLGWRAWVLSEREPVNRDLWTFPPGGRLHQPRRPPLTRRIANRAMARPPRRRLANWWDRAVRDAAPDVIHVHFGWVAAGVEVHRFGVPALVSFHGADATAWPHASEHNRARCTALFREIQRATAVSSFIERHVRDLGYTGPLDILPAGVRLDRFPFHPPRMDRESLDLLFVGRLVEKKGVDTLLSAFATILAERPVARLQIIGDGPLLADLEALAQRCGVSRAVTFSGRRSPAEIAAAMHDADVMVVPSRVPGSGDAEGSPVVTKEALASGIPLVATDSGGIAETIPPEHRHELCPPDDPAALAHRVVRLAEQRDEWPARCRLAREWVESAFDWNRLAERLVRIYEDMAGPATAGSRARRPSRLTRAA